MVKHPLMDSKKDEDAKLRRVQSQLLPKQQIIQECL